MENGGRSALIYWMLSVIIGLFLTASYIGLENQETPYNAAISFTKALYRLDPAMKRWLCSDLTEDARNNPADEYLYEVRSKTADRGFPESFARNRLFHIETETRMKDPKTAEVHLTAHRRVAINPLYVIVAKIFQIGESHEVSHTFRVVQEGGAWKVCGDVFTQTL